MTGSLTPTSNSLSTRDLAPGTRDNQGIRLSQQVITQLRYAAKIRDAFFVPGESTPNVQFELKPMDLDPNAASFRINIEGQTDEYAHGQAIAGKFQWPGPHPNLGVVLSFMTRTKGGEQNGRRPGRGSKCLTNRTSSAPVCAMFPGLLSRSAATRRNTNCGQAVFLILLICKSCNDFVVRGYYELPDDISQDSTANYLIVGDFVSRRLPASFVLLGRMAASRLCLPAETELGAEWLETYLTSPIWRFALSGGVCGDRACAGIFMPSVDKVGRYFPLTLAAFDRASDNCQIVFH